jgi:hypothetical protein
VVVIDLAHQRKIAHHENSVGKRDHFRHVA